MSLKLTAICTGLLTVFFALTSLGANQEVTITTTEAKELCKQEGKQGKELLECIRQKLGESKKGNLNSDPKND